MRTELFSTVSCAAVIAGVFGACQSPDSTVSTERVAQAPAPSERLVTLQGCLTKTSDPEIFILAVPGQVVRTVRGIGEGQPVPPGAEAGPTPADPPTSIPPPKPVAPPPFEPQGRFATPTIRNLTYRLEGDGGANLGSMIGKTIEVTGMLPTEGYPSGDLPAAANKTQSSGSGATPLATRSVRFVSDGCRGRR
jgi:hypothetical protein